MLRQGIGPLATVRARSSTVISAELVFADRDANDKLQNAVGDVALEDTTVAQLEAWRTIPNLLAEMLRISRVPVPNDFGVSLASFENPANQIGSTLQIDGITIRYVIEACGPSQESRARLHTVSQRARRL